MTTITALFIAASANYNLPPGLLSSLCYVESTHNVNAIHEDDGSTDSLGICQLKYATAQFLGFEGTEEQLMEPSENIYYAAAYLAHQLRRYNGDITKAIISYNRGSAGLLTRTEYSDKIIKQWRQN